MKGVIPCEAVHLYPSVIIIVETLDYASDGDKERKETEKGFPFSISSNNK
jgi:hypothetical protein